MAKKKTTTTNKSASNKNGGKASTTTKKSSSVKSKKSTPSLQSQIKKSVKKEVKKVAKKNPVGLLVGIIIILVVIAITLVLLIKFEVIDLSMITGHKPFTGAKLNGKDKVALNIGDTYHEDGVTLVIKDKEIDSSLYTYTVKYYTKGEDNKFETNDDIEVSTIDTTTNVSYLAKYGISYNEKQYETLRYIYVGVEPISINLLTLGSKYNGDSIYIKAGDTDILIDAGSRKESSTAIYDYVAAPGRCEDNKLEFVIATHAHQDHIAGFVGSKANPSLLDRFEVENLIQFAQTESNTQLYKDYKNKVDSLKGKTNIYTALDCYKELNGAKRSYDIAVGTTLNVLYTKYYEQSAKGNENEYSVCISIDHGENHYLLTRDLEDKGEISLVESNTLPEMEFFKANHHGSYTANSDELLSVIKPKNIGISCVAGSDEFTQVNANQFPAKKSLSVMEKYTDSIFVTSQVDGDSYKDMNGVITFYSEAGKDYTFTGSNNSTKLKDTDWYIKNRK